MDTDPRPLGPPPRGPGESDRKFTAYTEKQHYIMDEDIIHTQNHRISRAIHTLEFKDNDHNLIPDTNRYLTSAEFTDLYNEIQNTMCLESLPIVQLEDLPLHESCVPPQHKESDENINKISTYLYRRLVKMIPQSHTLLRGLIAQYSLKSRGYDALYALARHSLDYLKPTQNGWGPEWTNNDDPGSYAGKLLDFMRNSKLSHKHDYTELDQSHEFVYRAMQHYNYTAGCVLLGQLYTYRRLTPNANDQPVPNHLDLTTMLHFMIENPHMDHRVNQTPTTIVNKVNTPRKRFEYKNKVQCKCCHQFGHNIGDQICRYGAQLHYTQKYAADHPEPFKLNAIKHNNINSKPIVNHFESKLNGRIITEAEHELEREELTQLLVVIPDDDTK